MTDLFQQAIDRKRAVSDLVTWYQSAKRPLPWRQTDDPYRIWVSETMLQQTQVATVIPYYHEFLNDFPTVQHLAQAEEQAVLKRWQGLGYYSRARNLHKGAKAVVADHGGVIPRSPEQFGKLAGVGPYTRGAVMSIAFNLPEPAVDGNVYRVMSRLFGIREAIESAAVKQAVFDETRRWVELERPADVTQGLMELGATVCTPKSTDCGSCPLAKVCYARQHDAVAELPVRQPKRDRKVYDVAAIWFEADNTLLLEQRPADGLLATMWQLPSIEFERMDGRQVPERVLTAALRCRFNRSVQHEPDSLSWQEAACAREGIGLGNESAPAIHDFVEIARLKHTFTHVEWHVHVYRPVGILGVFNATSMEDVVLYREGRLRLVPRAQVKQLPIPRVYERLFQEVGLFSDNHEPAQTILDL